MTARVPPRRVLLSCVPRKVRRRVFDAVDAPCFSAAVDARALRPRRRPRGPRPSRLLAKQMNALHLRAMDHLFDLINFVLEGRIGQARNTSS